MLVYQPLSLPHLLAQVDLYRLYIYIQVDLYYWYRPTCTTSSSKRRTYGVLNSSTLRGGWYLLREAKRPSWQLETIGHLACLKIGTCLGCSISSVLASVF